MQEHMEHMTGHGTLNPLFWCFFFYHKAKIFFLKEHFVFYFFNYFFEPIFSVVSLVFAKSCEFLFCENLTVIELFFLI